MSLRDAYLTSDALGLAELVRRGETNARELLEVALEITEECNPTLNAVVYRFEELAEASIARGTSEGILGGVPFLLKDLYSQMDGTPMSNGSRMYADFRCDHDAEIVRRYKEAGLVIFGRSASPEFGLTTTTESILHGVTRNPWSHEHTAGGSSGGAAAAVAAGIVPAAHATDGGGSIRIPASCCGLFGLKPTRARVPMGPDMGEGWSGMSAGHAVTVSVRDSAALLDAVAGPDPGDPYAAPALERPLLEEVGDDPGKLRIAVAVEAFNGVETDPECVRAVEAVAALCGELGHQVFEAYPEIDREAVADATRLIVGANVGALIEDRARELGREVAPDDDVEPLTWATWQAVADRGAADYARATKVLHATGRRVAEFFGGCDVLLTPTMAAPPQAIGKLSLAQKASEEFLPALLKTIAFTQLMNVCGNPAMSVPLHWSEAGLPVGLQFAASFGDEATLFRLATQLEGARPWKETRASSVN